MNKRAILQDVLVFFSSLLALFLLFQWLIPVAPPRLSAKDYQQIEHPLFHYVALGDSLTEGVGDTTNQGGFVPLLAQSLDNTYGYQVEVVNYGVAGNTSQQILKRMTQQEDIQASLKTADLLTLTVGGNDLRQAILADMDQLTIARMKEPAKAYTERLARIIQEARKDNPNLPIYILGVYNPFYLTFPDLTDLQTIVDNWNQVTADTAARYEQVYFVPINELIYQGSSEQEGAENNLLYKEDSFHPNQTGYDIIKQAILEAIHETKEDWK